MPCDSDVLSGKVSGGQFGGQQQAPKQSPQKTEISVEQEQNKILQAIFKKAGNLAAAEASPHKEDQEKVVHLSK